MTCVVYQQMSSTDELSVQDDAQFTITTVPPSSPRLYKHLILRPRYVIELIDDHYEELKDVVSCIPNAQILFVYDTCDGDGVYCRDEDTTAVRDFCASHTIVDNCIVLHHTNGVSAAQWLSVAEDIMHISPCYYIMKNIIHTEDTLTLIYHTESG